MDISVLQKLGLTKSETDVYVTLLRTGPATITPLKNAVHIHPSKIYEHIHSLEKKGLVSFITTTKGKTFSASHPESLITMMDNRILEIEKTKSALQKTVHELKTIQPERKEELPAMVYEGFNGFRQIFSDIVLNMKSGDVYYVLGANVVNKTMEIFFAKFNEERIKRGIRQKIIFNFDNIEYAKRRAKLKFAEIRYLPKKIPVPAYIVIAGDNLLILYMTEKSALTFVIKNKDIAAGHLNYFNIMWRFARKP